MFFVDPTYQPYAGPCYFDHRVRPEKARMLRGDTAHLVSERCVVLGKYRADSVLVLSNWLLTGAAVEATRPDGTPLKGAEERIVVRGVRPGTSVVTVTDVKDSTRLRQDTVFVADTSEIVSVTVFNYNPKDSLRVGGTRNVRAVLRDVTLQSWKGKPTEWTISDTSVFEFLPDSAYYPYGRETRVIRAKKPGTALVRTKFLELRDSLAITVYP